MRKASLFFVAAAIALGSTKLASAQVAQEPGYVLDYNLNIKTATTGGFSANGVPYTNDNSLSIPANSFDRVAYQLTLSGSTNAASPNGNVWVSFDKQSSDASKLGVPTTGTLELYKQAVANMNVIADASSGVSNATGLTNGNIQFWPSDYGPNSNTNKFDWNNSGGNNSQGYGAMQISQITAPNGSTGNMFISFNNWSSNSAYDIGLGNNTGSTFNGVDPNYTFRNNIGDYSSAVLTVWVHPTPEPGSLTLIGFGAAGLLARRRR